MNKGINLLAVLSAGLILTGRKGGSFGRKRRELSEEEIALLGTMSDTDVGNILGLSKNTVRKKRNSLGIAPYTNFFNANQDAVILLGTKSDVDVANELGLTPGYVTTKRRELGIPAYSPPLQHEDLFTDEIIGMIGEVPDHEIADMLGIDRMAIRRARVKLGLQSPRLANRTRSTDEIWTLENIALLGTMSDYRLASIIGISIPSVVYMRNKLGIPSHTEDWK